MKEHDDHTITLSYRKIFSKGNLCVRFLINFDENKYSHFIFCYPKLLL